MKIIKSGDKGFEQVLQKLDSRLTTGSSGVLKTVSQIMSQVRKHGDKALFWYTKKFDSVAYTARSVRVSSAEFAKAQKLSNPKVVKALKASAGRIKKFHKNQIERSWSIKEKGVRMGQAVKPICSAGIYVPGGLAAYPSSVLMNAIPARLALVKRIVMATPTPGGTINPHVLVAAQIAGVGEVYKVGGAQAVAAMAYGTKSIAPVDKIVGPGNAYVAEAKRQVFGKVDIDMIAGPSEILVLADSFANPKFIAADLLSQAEHDANAFLILVTTSARLAERVEKELKSQTESLERKAIIKKCLAKNSYTFIVKNLDEGFDLANRFAPEHMELLITNATKYVSRVENAGALFVGPWSPEVLGDYGAGPNHVLPTGGTARFFSPLGVYDFMKRTSVISYDKRGLKSIAKDVTTLAYEEGLSAHARAVEMRLEE